VFVAIWRPSGWPADITAALDVDGALAEVKRRASTAQAAADDVSQPARILVGVVVSRPLYRSALPRVLQQAPRGMRGCSSRKHIVGRHPTLDPGTLLAIHAAT
jgi:hypothetical protein